MYWLICMMIMMKFDIIVHKFMNTLNYILVKFSTVEFFKKIIDDFFDFFLFFSVFSFGAAEVS
jgi:hypothetical protein